MSSTLQHAFYDNEFHLWFMPILFFGLCIFAIVKRKKFEGQLAKLSFIVVVLGFFGVLGLHQATQSLEYKAARVEVWKSGISCRPWGFRSWAYFSDMELIGPRFTVPFLLNQDIKFTLNKRYIDQGEWNDFIKTRGAINCDLGDLDASPGIIFDAVYSAWQKGKDTPPES